MDRLEWHLLEDKTVDRVEARGIEIRRGARVRLIPRAGGDILDMALVGRTATVESIEQDYENRVHVAVVLDDDPGRDLGAAGQPGHRFFFSPSEIEPCETEGEYPAREEPA